MRTDPGNGQNIKRLFLKLLEKPDEADAISSELAPWRRGLGLDRFRLGEFFVDLAESLCTLTAREMVEALDPDRSSPSVRPASGPQCSEDFTWIKCWAGSFEFSKGNQAETIRVLWTAWEGAGRYDGAGLTNERIAEEIGSSNQRFRVDDTFRRHEAFGEVIRRTGPGKYGLFLNGPPEPSGSSGY